MSTATLSALTGKPLTQEFESLFREHYQLVYRTALRVTRSAEDAEDILQTIFLRLLDRELTPELRKAPKSYLYRAAVNASLDVIRSRQKRVLVGNTDGFEVSSEAGNSEAREEIHRKLYEAIAELSPKSAHILILRYVHGYSDADIAALLGTSRGTIAVSLYRSRGRLRKIICNWLGGSHDTSR